MMGPCLISHGKIVHGQRDVIATGLEHLLMMGVSATLFWRFPAMLHFYCVVGVLQP